MNKLCAAIIKGRYIILIVFILLVALSAVGYFYVNINSDVTSYLDEDTMTYIGKQELEDRFGITGEMSVGISGLSYEEVSAVIAAIEEELNTPQQIGDSEQQPIRRIAWLGTFDAVKTAIENGTTQGNLFEREGVYAKLQDKFYVEESDTYLAFLYLTAPNSDDVNVTLIHSIEKLLDEKLADTGAEYFLGGGAVNAKNLLESSIGEIPKYLIVAVILIAAILLVTTKSFIEPIIFLLTLGIAILLNVGSNVFLPQVSSITFASSTILQLAISMDFAIFFMHTFYEEKRLDVDTRTAIQRAIPRTLKSISASALTTIGGFMALFVMKFGMGFDLGLVLAKGVVFSLLAVVFLQPVLIYLLRKPIMRTQHKYFEPSLKKTSGISIKFRYVIIAVCLALAIPACILQFNVPISYLQITESSKNVSVTEEAINKSNNQLIVIVPNNSVSNQYAFIDELEKINSEGLLKNGEEGRSISIFSMYSLFSAQTLSLAESFQPQLYAELQAGFVSNGYTMYAIRVDGNVEDETSYKAIELITSAADSVFGENTLAITGMAQGAYDLNKVTPNDFVMVSVLSAAIIFVILLLSYIKRPWLSVVLLLVIEIGIWINLAIVTLVGESINFMSYIIISSIELGATVDYAILFTNTLLENKKKNPDWSLKKLIKRTVSSSSASILVSASILIVACFAVYLITSNVIVGEITMLIARGSILSSFLVLTLLPSILYTVYDLSGKIRAKKKLTLATEIPTGDSGALDIADTSDNKEQIAPEQATDCALEPQATQEIEQAEVSTATQDTTKND